MSPGNVATTLLLSLCTSTAGAQGYLETPRTFSATLANSFASGIGIISGWHCTSKRIGIVIDGQKFYAASGTRRDDTLAVCGRSDTGFSLLFNWNTLPGNCSGCRTHLVSVFADDIFPVGGAVVDVSYFGMEFMTGKSGTYRLANFPAINAETLVRWDEASQNFSIVYTNWNEANRVVPDKLTGIYYGALFTVPGNNLCGPFSTVRVPRFGSFDVRYKSGTLSLTASFIDGGMCELPAAAIELPTGVSDAGMIIATFDEASTAACPEFPGGLRLQVNGERLVAYAMDHCMSTSVVAGK
jgi:hypothetical protein